MNLVRSAVHPSVDTPVRLPAFCAFVAAADFGHLARDGESKYTHITPINPLRRSLGEFSSTKSEDDVMDSSRTANTSTHQPTFAAMSRLIVGNPFDVSSPESIKAWQEVEAKFAQAKREA